jgi:hypothetical protein
MAAVANDVMGEQGDTMDVNCIRHLIDLESQLSHQPDNQRMTPRGKKATSSVFGSALSSNGLVLKLCK